MKTKIEADLMPILGDHPEGFRTGDFLIVIRGVCVGVQYKDDFPPPPTPPPLRIAPPAVAVQSPVDTDVLEAIRKLKAASRPSKSVHIAKVLGIEDGDKEARGLLSVVVQSLKKRGVIRGKTDDRIPDYVICGED